MCRSCREDNAFSDAMYEPLWQQIEQAQQRARRSRKRRLARQRQQAKRQEATALPDGEEPQGRQTRQTQAEAQTRSQPHPDSPRLDPTPLLGTQARQQPSDLRTSPSARPPTTRHQGDLAETRALQHLQQAGLVLLARNLQCRTGEIDLVMRDGAVLVFVEVRLRRDDHHGGAAASVDWRKQRRLARTAAHFLPMLTRRWFQDGPPRCRFDVVTQQGDSLTWLPDAFPAP